MRSKYSSRSRSRRTSNGSSTTASGAAPCGGAGSPVDDWRRSYGLHLPAPSGSAVRLLSRLTAGGFQRWPADADPAGFDRMKNRGDEQALPVDTVRARADQLSFTVAGAAANQHDRPLHQFVGGWIAAGVALYSRRRSGVIHASFFQPLLDDMRALAPRAQHR